MDQSGSKQTDPVLQKFILCRGITSLILAVLSFICMLTAVINISVEFGWVLSSDSACSLKAAFGLFVVATGAILFLVIWDSIHLCMLYYTKGCCHCECYHMNFAFQTASFGMILVGAIIYGAKEPDRVGLGFWFSFSASILCLISSIMWLVTQHLKRIFRPSGGGNMSSVGGGGSMDLGF